MAAPADETSTIRLQKTTKRKLKALKKHPRETDNETVRRALDKLASAA